MIRRFLAQPGISLFWIAHETLVSLADLERFLAGKESPLSRDDLDRLTACVERNLSEPDPNGNYPNDWLLRRTIREKRFSPRGLKIFASKAGVSAESLELLLADGRPTFEDRRTLAAYLCSRPYRVIKRSRGLQEQYDRSPACFMLVDCFARSETFETDELLRCGAVSEYADPAEGERIVQRVWRMLDKRYSVSTIFTEIATLFPSVKTADVRGFVLRIKETHAQRPDGAVDDGLLSCEHAPVLVGHDLQPGEFGQLLPRHCRSETRPYEPPECPCAGSPHSPHSARYRQCIIEICEPCWGGRVARWHGRDQSVSAFGVEGWTFGEAWPQPSVFEWPLSWWEVSFARWTNHALAAYYEIALPLRISRSFGEITPEQHDKGIEEAREKMKAKEPGEPSPAERVAEQFLLERPSLSAKMRYEVRREAAFFRSPPVDIFLAWLPWLIRRHLESVFPQGKKDAAAQ